MAIFLNTYGHAIAANLTIFVIFATMARPIMAINSNILWSFLTLLQRLAKCRSTVKTELKNGQKKIQIEIMTIFHVYLGDFDCQMVLPEEALPM